MIKLFKRLKIKKLIGMLPISHESLIELGYDKHACGYYCAPYPADGATYRLELKAPIFENIGGKGLFPKAGTEEWRAYLTHSDKPTIRRFKTISELNHFHKGMCGEYLF